MDVAEPLALPRSVLLALWLPSALASAEGRSRAVRAVTGDDEPHLVSAEATGDDDAGPGSASLSDLLARWAEPGVPVHSAALLPVPGDVSGLVPAVADIAVDAGECALVSLGELSWALVPEVEEFGSAWETGHLVTWQLREVPAWGLRLPGLVGSLSEAEQALRRALLEATEALAGLDVARWREDAAATIASLRSDQDPGWDLPRDVAPRSLQVLARAVRLRAIVALATADDGGAMNLWQADRRSEALRHVDHASRRAVAAATAAATAQPRTDR